ncbi:MAG: hypothetical protein QOJ63_647 [Solirubrobacteraceae bacterium]|jgi:hypothetical protein|nr:hypothetical protein [Solirubrobacteraceae bacterium]
MIASGEDGISVVETVLAAALGLVILSAALLTLERAFTANRQVFDRVEASQRARVAMDWMTRELRSSVCPDPFTAALISGSANSVSFFADLGDGTKPAVKYTLTYDQSKRTISESRYDGTGASPSTTWPTTPTSTRVLIANVVTAGSEPAFRFNAFDTASPPRPTIVLPTPLTAAGVASASRITMTFSALPTGRSTQSPLVTTLQDQVDLRSADPNQPKPAPQCT